METSDAHILNPCRTFLRVSYHCGISNWLMHPWYMAKLAVFEGLIRLSIPTYTALTASIRPLHLVSQSLFTERDIHQHVPSNSWGCRKCIYIYTFNRSKKCYYNYFFTGSMYISLKNNSSDRIKFGWILLMHSSYGLLFRKFKNCTK